MKHFCQVAILFFVYAISNAQTPFGIKNKVVIYKSPQKIQEYLQSKEDYGLPLNKYEVQFQAAIRMNKQLQGGKECESFKVGILKEVENPEVAEKLSTGIVISDDVNKLFPTIVGNVVNYRLRLWSRVLKKGPDKNDTAIVYLPLSIISKISGATGNSSGTLNDAASFFGAPFTLRFSPNFVDVDVDNKNGRFVVGMHHDLRVLAIADTATNKAEAGFGYYGALGFTYFNTGQVFNEEAKDWIEGKWSFSALLYFFKSGGKFNKAVFGDYKNRTLSGIECMLRFRTNSDANKKFNFFFGTNYGFSKDVPNKGKWDFRMGIGN